MLRFYKEGILKNIIPLMLCVSMVACCMYVYSKEYLALFVFITLVIQINVFSFYTFLSKKSMILRFISILGSFFAIGGMVTIALRTGNNKSSMDYFIWFLSPQALVEFSMPYIAATFIIINFFIASTVYYFSAVRYRISMTFMITLIPFAVYRKEGTQVPVFFALLLLVMYTALMIHCRQINLKPRQKILIDTGYKRSMAVFLAFSALAALVLPKPEVNIDNSWVDTVFESDKITEYMLHRLGIVSDTASSSVNYTGTTNVKLFEFKVEEEPINLKSQTYSVYDFKNNIWHTSEDETQGPLLKDTDAMLLDPVSFYRAVAEASALDKNFAEKYNIQNLKPELKNDYKRSVSLVLSRVPSKFYYSPVLVYSTSGNDVSVHRSEQGMIYAEKTSGMNYSVDYYSDSSAYNPDMKKILNALNNENFSDFLDELKVIFSENNITEYDDVVNAYISDYEKAMMYQENDETFIPDSITAIAEKIIKKKNSDFERATAIQDYFKYNDFVYNLSYKKPEEYNMEFFLTEGKNGICTDYATAMVMLARAVDIPARYAEGIHLHDSDENRIVTVTDSDLHAFPELYISGFGWMSFEPTQLTVTPSGSSFDVRMSVVLAFAALLIIIFVLFFDRYIGPYISEKLFFSRFRKASDEKSVEMAVVRIRKVLGLEESATSAEVGKYIFDLYGINMNSTVDDFDRAVYGGESLNAESKNTALEIYEKLKGFKKEERKTHKRRRVF